MAAKPFIAVKRPGALTKKAQAAGMGVHAYALSQRSAKSLTGQQARFMLNVLSPSTARRKRRSALARRLGG